MAVAGWGGAVPIDATPRRGEDTATTTATTTTTAERTSAARPTSFDSSLPVAASNSSVPRKPAEVVAIWNTR